VTGDGAADLPGAGPGDLTFDVECRTSRRGARGRRHPVTIHADWTVTTPHDLDAERVAAAFGGYSSCLELVDAGVPALREVVALGSRRARPELVWDRAWRLPRLEVCGCPTSFVSAAAFGCAERVVRTVGAMVLDLVPDVTAPCHHPARCLVREHDGVAELWDAGIHPDDVAAMAGLVPAVHEPLPVRYYLGVAYRDPGPELLAASAARPDADTAAWLAWLDPRWRDSGADLAGWLEVGLARGDALELLAQGPGPAAAAGMAGDLGIDERRAGRLLAQWVRVGCRPSAAHLRLLMAEGLETYRPSGHALDELVAQARRFRVERTELAVMLALADTRADVLGALHHGVRSAEELAGRLGPGSPAPVRRWTGSPWTDQDPVNADREWTG
jgi:hypothetical protein